MSRAVHSATDANLKLHALEPAFRRLIAVALDQTEETYGRLGDYIEKEASISTIFKPRVGLIVGLLMQRIQEVAPNSPLINVLAVNQRDRLPSHGAGQFMAARFEDRQLEREDYKERFPVKWQNYFKRAADEVYAYSEDQWADLYSRVFQKPYEMGEIEKNRAERKEGNEQDFGTGKNKYGRGGESEHHRSLRLWTMTHPEMVRSSFQTAETETEMELDSGDRVDVTYRLEDRIVLLEVKSYISNENDMRRGVYQCIKYRAVKAAMDIRSNPIIETFLVTETKPSGYILGLLKDHKILHFLAPISRSGS